MLKNMFRYLHGRLFDFGIRPNVLSTEHDRHHAAGVVNRLLLCSQHLWCDAKVRQEAG